MHPPTICGASSIERWEISNRQMPTFRPLKSCSPALPNDICARQGRYFMKASFCTPLDITQIEQNFADINPAFAPAEALHEANRCLYCYDAPCMHACPTHIDVPAFIKKIATGNLHGSAKVIFDANPIGATCARVCPVEVLCEGACVEKTLLQKPIEIGRLQRYATDHVLAN